VSAGAAVAFKNCFSSAVGVLANLSCEHQSGTGKDGADGPGIGEHTTALGSASVFVICLHDIFATLSRPEFAGFVWVGGSFDRQGLSYRKGAIPAFTYELGTGADLVPMGTRGFLRMGESLRTSKQL
jgi:hypothetical protein